MQDFIQDYKQVFKPNGETSFTIGQKTLRYSRNSYISILFCYSTTQKAIILQNQFVQNFGPLLFVRCFIFNIFRTRTDGLNAAAVSCQLICQPIFIFLILRTEPKKSMKSQLTFTKNILPICQWIIWIQNVGIVPVDDLKLVVTENARRTFNTR